MYVLNHDEFSDSDLTNIKNFVTRWSSYFPQAVESVYRSHIWTGNQLTDDNIKALLKWKDPRFLSKSESSKDQRLKNIIERCNSIRDFREGSLSEHQFKMRMQGIFKHGIVYSAFLFHIARPCEYPMIDMNVLTAYTVLNRNNKITNLEQYLGEYKVYFFSIDKKVNGYSSKDYPIKKRIEDLKKIDNALFCFGQFLRNYNNKNSHEYI